MKAKFLSAFAVMFAIALPAVGRPPNPIIEDGHEYEGSMLKLPSSAAGQVEAVACYECLTRRYTLGPQVQFFIGEREVSYVEFKNYVLAKPTVPLVIVTKTETTEVTRMRVGAR